MQCTLKLRLVLVCCVRCTLYAVYLTCNRVIRFFPYTFDFRTCPFPSYDPFHIFADSFHGRKGDRGAWGGFPNVTDTQTQIQIHRHIYKKHPTRPLGTLRLTTWYTRDSTHQPVGNLVTSFFLYYLQVRSGQVASHITTIINQ